MATTKLPKIDKALFLGCLIPARLPFIEKSAKVVCKDLNIQLHPMLGAACCPEPIGVNSVDEKTWLTLATRNVTVAEDMNQKDIITFCSGCTLSLKAANDTMKSDAHRKEEVNKQLSSINKEFKGTVSTVRHVAQVVYDEIGLENIKALVKKPLTGLKVAMHYGCHFIKPSGIMDFEDPFYPSKVEEILQTLGAETVDYTEKLLCCGQGVSNEDPEVQTDMNFRKYKSIQEAGASCICVVCPSCYQNLEGGQRNVKKKFGEKYDFPVLYLTDLLALAMGHSPDEIGLKFHRPSPKKILAEIGIGGE
ncbi:MAG: CoB--CoM heterodisulfide reductase iron-sulfur subunit B family protein [Candidatus Hodarchaeota archaeon]